MSVKGMWDALQTLYEEKKDVGDSQVIMFIEEF